MKPGYYWKWLLVIFLAAWAISEITPPWSASLIDQFEQDASVSTDESKTLLTTVVSEARKKEEASPGRTYANMFDAIGTNDVRALFPEIKIAEDEEQPVKVVLNDLQQRASGQVRLGLDLQGGVSFTVAMETNVLSADQDQQVVLEQSIEVL